MASKTPPSDALAAWLARQRWFAGKSRRIATIAVDDRVPLGGAVVLVTSVELDDGRRDLYAVPLRDGGGGADALDDPAFGLALLDLVRTAGSARGDHGEITGHPTRVFPHDLPPALPVRRLGAEQSNTSVAFGDRLILKHFRRLAEGPSPDQEIGRFLTERTAFRNSPRLAGHLDYRRPEGRAMTLAVLHELVPDARDGWEWVLAELGRFFERVRESGARPDRQRLRALGGTTLDAFRRLGELTAELHRALASDREDATFAPEPITPADVARWAEAVRRQLEEAGAALGDPSLARRLPALADGLQGLAGRAKIRHHGDYHLGQTLYRPADRDFVIIDFEGEPLRPIAERREKHAALRDVAGMLRSIDYAGITAAPAGLESWASAWQAAAAAEFLGAYRAVARGAPFVPEADDGFTRAVLVFELEKAAYEVVYETRHRPDWVAVPAGGLRRAAAALTGSGRAGAA